jgi:SNF family Na+-dependent transporter
LIHGVLELDLYYGGNAVGLVTFWFPVQAIENGEGLYNSLFVFCYGIPLFIEWSSGRYGGNLKPQYSAHSRFNGERAVA